MNPMQIALQMMNSPQITNNPMAKNVLSMARKGDVKGIEQFGRNMAAERGIDFDKAFSQFKSQFLQG